jgi:hypothetical protein
VKIVGAAADLVGDVDEGDGGRAGRFLVQLEAAQVAID